MLSTNDLRFIAEELLDKCDFKPEDYGLDEFYLRDIRDGMLKMINMLEQTGEVEIELSRERMKCKEKEDTPPIKEGQ